MVYLHAGESPQVPLHPCQADARSPLVAESHLLHPRPAPTADRRTSQDPQLSSALEQLDASLSRYGLLVSAGNSLSSTGGGLTQFASFVYKSWGGLFRSRGWIQ